MSSGEAAGHVAAARDARRERFGAIPGARWRFWMGHGAWPARGRDAVPDVRRQRTASSRRETERRDGGERKFVNKVKFKIPVWKPNFSPYSKGQMKNF